MKAIKGLNIGIFFIITYNKFFFSAFELYLTNSNGIIIRLNINDLNFII